MKKKNTVTLLDCTMRDGGYYNQWDFSLNVARNYIQAISDAGIDVVEIGFRFFPEDFFSENFLKKKILKQKVFSEIFLKIF